MAVFNGTTGDDIFTGGTDPDTATGGGGNDTLSGGDNNDTLSGDAGADTLNGGEGEDYLYSASVSPPFNLPYYGNLYTPPVLDTGTEVDTLNGGNGSDRLFAGYGDNVDGGGNGSYGDYLYISFMGATSGVTADFGLATQVIGGGTITGVENISWIQGSNFDDNINSRSNSYGYTDFTAVFGMGGNDILTAGYYTGVLDGGDGNDVVDGRGSQYLQAVYGGAGNDILYTATNTFGSAYGGDGNDTIYSHGTTYGGAGNDLIVLQWSYYSGYVYGEDGDDEIRASDVGHVMVGGAGADKLTGASGNDYLYSAGVTSSTPDDDLGLERDTIAGGGGNDTISAGYGDNIDGGTGTDSLRLSLAGSASGVALDTSGIVSGSPVLLGGGIIQNIENLVYVRGSNQGDVLTFATQGQLLTVDAGDGDDQITTSASSVVASGGNGNDRFISGAAGDTFDGGADIDTIDYRNSNVGVTVSLAAVAGESSAGPGGDSLRNIENIDGSAFGDSLNGNNDDNLIQGMAGNDSLNGGGGNDVLRGGANDDILIGNSGNDTLDGDGGADTASYLGAFTGVTVNLGIAGSQDTVGAGLDTLMEIENLTGSAHADRLTGDDGANVLDGGAGADILSGGLGDDTYFDDGTDQIVEGAGAGTDTVMSAITYVLGANLENLTLTGAGAINGTGNDLDNILTGNSGANQLSGGLGNDTYVIDSTDTITEAPGTGRDTVVVTFSYTLGAELEDLVLAGQSAINGSGNGVANVITGNSASNTLDGKGGADTMAGGLGDDVYFVDIIGDIAVEGAGAGIDTVHADVSLVLGDNLENLVLLAGALNGTGNGLANSITGNGADNILDGKAGADVMAGGLGHDTYHVDNAGDVIVEAGGGNDNVLAAMTYVLPDNVEYITLTGTDMISATGNALNNIINGNSSANFLVGGLGADFMTGGGGDDTYFVDNASDEVFEFAGGGADTVSSSVNWTLGSEVERLILTGTFEINGTGNAYDNVITGNDSANRLDGGIGADTMLGGLGNDTYVVDNAGDVAIDNGGLDTVLSSVTIILHDSIDDLVLTGTGAINGTGNGLWNVMTGNAAANTLDGGVGNDILNGGLGADTLIGGSGHDTYYVDNVGDQVIDTGGGNDHVHSSIDYVLGADLEYVTLTGTAISATGNAQNNLLYGNASNNILDGKLGADHMVGGLGDDIYYVENGGDQITEHLNQGTDTVMSSVHHALIGNIENLTLIGTSQVSATGNELNNVIIGNSANNVISGGLGADTLSGGGGNDVYQYRFVTESTAASKDQINGFNAGDKINLSILDANTNTAANNDAFTFIGSNAFHNVAGELRATESGGVWTIQADVNGDGIADLTIGLTTESGYLIGAGDFML